MDAGAALAALEDAGTEQNRKIYRRHGYPEPMYGVSFAALRTMARQIGRDQGLAEDLWETGNTDARFLAAMVADADALTRDVADRWVAEARCHTLIDEIAKVVAGSPLALPCMAEWVGSDDEWIGRGGWSVMAVLADRHPEVPDASFTPYLAVIERRLDGAKNRTREAMNTAMIAIGGRSDALSVPALAAAARIGTIEVDHGETGCKTPDASAYITRMRARAAQAAARRAAARGNGAGKPQAPKADVSERRTAKKAPRRASTKVAAKKSRRR